MENINIHSRKKNSILFYDGDGGGFCAQLRHLFEIHFISKLTGKYIYDNYPLTHRFFRYTSNYIDEFQSDECILMSDLVNSTGDFSELCREIKKTDAIILSGRHHYSKHFQKYLEECIGGDKVYRYQKKFLRELGCVDEPKKTSII